MSQIAELFEIQLTASQARLRQIKEREDRLLKLLKDLDDHLQPQNEQAKERAIADYQNELQLRRWVDQRRVSVNEELAQTKVLLGIAKADVALHFARQEASKELIERSKATSRQLAQRRANFEV